MIRWTSRQLIDATYLEYSKESKSYVAKHSFITKLLPGSRRIDLIGLRGLRDLESLNMIADNIFLVRFRGSDLSQRDDYWSVINSEGQILPIPEKAKPYLVWSNKSAGDSRNSRFDTCVILRGGHERVISLGSDLAFKEKHITKINFTRSGEVGWISQYRKSQYEKKFQERIKEQLMKNTSLLKSEFKDRGISDEEALKMTQSLQYQQKIHSRHSGDLYRIASIIVDERFTDDVVVNPLGSQGGQAEKLNMGIFEVESKKFKEEED